MALAGILLIPLMILLYRILGGESPDPLKEIYTYTGLGALALLFGTLALTPLSRYSSLKLISYRRFLGLFSFFYATLHFGAYLILDLSLEWSALRNQAVQKPFVLLGFFGWMILAGLALTSIPKLWKRFQRGHIVIYLALWLGAIHYFMAQKVAQSPHYFVLFLALLLTLLKAIRLSSRLKRLSNKL